MSREEEYYKFVKSLTKDGEDIKKSLTGRDCHLIHMSMGLSSEAGELMDAIKKYTIYRKPLDLENVIEELGDFEFFLEGIRSSLNITRRDVISGNIEKLSKRYSSGTFSNKEAIDRADK